jgi:1,4-dihydroxy-6-naphthoate synthase
VKEIVKECAHEGANGNAPAKLRVGISPCPNDVFIFAGWLLGRTPAPAADFVFEDVQTLNARARAGELDLVKVSTANLPACPGYEMLECGGALGRGCGPLLLTGGADWDPGAEVLVPGAHTTANFLLDFWHGREAGYPAGPLQKRFLPFDILYRELKTNPRAQGVVIHEMRFTYERDGLRLVQDLGAAWEAATGKPIPLGSLIRRESPHLPSRSLLEQAVRDSLDWAWSHEAEALALCARYAQDMSPAVMRSHIDLYVNEFSRDLGEVGRDAVRSLLAAVRSPA